MTKSLLETENILAFFDAWECRDIRRAKDLLGGLDLSSLNEKNFLEELAARLRDSGSFNKIKKTDGKGDTALHLAVREDHQDMVKFLVQLDISLCECANREGKNPLKLAVSLGFDEAAELLITRTSNALHYIVELNQVELVEYLMERKVDLSSLINQGYKPATNPPEKENRAPNPQHVQALDLGEQHPKEESSTNVSGDGGDKLSETAAENKNKAEEEKSKNSTGTDNQPIIVIGDTPLHIAARNKYGHMVNLLLKVPGVDKLALNSEDKTPFEIAREVTEYHESFRTIRKLGDFRRRPKRFMYCAPQVSHEKYKKAVSLVNEAYKERRNAELVVAALLAAMTCAALFTVPGGFNSESPSDVHDDQGSPLLVSLVSFKLFIIFDCIAFFLSLFVCTMWELSLDFNTKNKMLFMNINAIVVCLSFGFSACGFMCAVYAMLARKIKTFSWVVLGSLIFICLCIVLGCIHQSIHYIVTHARFDRLRGVSWFFDDIVEKVWCGAERCGLLNLCVSGEDVSQDLMTGYCKFKSHKGDDSSNNSHTSPSCCFNHV